MNTAPKLSEMVPESAFDSLNTRYLGLVEQYEKAQAAHRATKAKLREVRAAARWLIECECEKRKADSVDIFEFKSEVMNKHSAWGALATLANYRNGR
jgi:hypothetical protein